MAKIDAQFALIQNTDKPKQITGRLAEIDLTMTIPVSQTYATATAERVDPINGTLGLRNLLGINNVKQMRFHTPLHCNQVTSGQVNCEFDALNQRITLRKIGNTGAGGVRLDDVELANATTVTGGASSTSVRVTVYI